MTDPASREREPGRRHPLIEQGVAEWRSLSRGEIAFLVPLAVLLVVVAVVGAGSPVTGILAALLIGLVGGAGIAVMRRRRERRAGTPSGRSAPR